MNSPRHIIQTRSPLYKTISLGLRVRAKPRYTVDHDARVLHHTLRSGNKLELTDLPALNASLNGLAAIFLVAGFVFIRRRNAVAHRLSMLTAFACSMAFLVSYLYYHSQVGSVRFQGTGPIRTLYFTVLISHTILAALVPFLAGVTLYRALRERFDCHRAIARWTLPIWLYVSVSGVVIYWMLYRM